MFAQRSYNERLAGAAWTGPVHEAAELWNFIFEFEHVSFLSSLLNKAECDWRLVTLRSRDDFCLRKQSLAEWAISREGQRRES